MKMMLDYMKLPKGVVAWLMTLITVNIIIPLFFLNHIEAKLILIGLRLREYLCI